MAEVLEEPKEWFSVWAEPPESARPRLKELMKNLRNEFGGPEFQPHVTIVGLTRSTRSEAIAKLEAASKEVKPFVCKVMKVTKGRFFFQCVFLLLEKTEEVMAANQQCSGHFGYVSSTSYMPHLSLLYGDLSEDKKDQAIDLAESLDETIAEFEFEVHSLSLYMTDVDDKTLKSWEKVVEIKLPFCQ